MFFFIFLRVCGRGRDTCCLSQTRRKGKLKVLNSCAGVCSTRRDDENVAKIIRHLLFFGDDYVEKEFSTISCE
jgi:hypothetical protein